MATIVTVHGTFASGPDTGEKWWQHSSPFEAHLSELLEVDDGELKFEPFIWSGLNSEASRRRAGHRLFNRLKTLDAEGEPYSIIGHSHGGSVIGASLMESAKRKNSLDNLKLWLTIGTPFIKTQKERLLFSRLGLWGKAAYVALITVALMYLMTIPPESLSWSTLINPLDWLAIGSFLLIILIPFWIFYFIMRFLNARKLHIYKPKTIEFADQGFRPRWLSLWHRNDEAVRGLTALRSMKLDIFPKGFAVNPISLLSVFILPLVMIWLVNSSDTMKGLHSTASNSYGYVSNTDKIEETEGDKLRLIGDGQTVAINVAFLMDLQAYGLVKLTNITQNTPGHRTALSIVTLPIILLLAALSITIIMSYLAKGISSFLSRKLNPLTMSQVRATALGSDTLEDIAVDAADWPMWMGKGFPPLPEPLGPDLQATSDAAVSKAVPKFRSALGSFAAAKSGKEKSDMLSEYLTWDELIHTSYFRNPQFRKLVAYVLSQSDGFHASKAFRQDKEYDLIAGLYKQLSNQTE